MADTMELLRVDPKAELIWASPRELLNVFQAHAIGCRISAVTNDVLKKLSLVGRASTSTRSRRSRCSATMLRRPVSRL
jgi:hypothetical protein